MIQEIYSERFKSLGWRKQGQNFRFIQDDGLGKIINFQKSKWNTKEEVTFFINYGIYIEVKDNIDNKSFKEYDCQFRNRTSYMNGTYTLNNDSTINEAIDMTATALKEASDANREYPRWSGHCKSVSLPLLLVHVLSRAFERFSVSSNPQPGFL